MVKLEEVQDESFLAEQPGPDDEEWDTDSDDSASETSHPTDETLSERLSALIDIIPPRTRRALSSTLSGAASTAWTGTRFAGKAAWVLGTAALLLAVPFALVSQEEAMLAEQERTQGVVGGMNEFVAPGAVSAVPGVPGAGGLPGGQAP